MSLRWNPSPLVKLLQRFAVQSFGERLAVSGMFVFICLALGLVVVGFAAAWHALRHFLLVAGLGVLLVCSGCTAVVGGIVGGTVGGSIMGAVVARGVASSRAPAAPGGKPAPTDWAEADEAAKAEVTRRAAFDKMTADTLAAEAKRRAAYDAATGREGTVQP
jgi:hypothetical protein